MVEVSLDSDPTTPEKPLVEGPAYDALAEWVLQIAGASQHKRATQQHILASILQHHGAWADGKEVKNDVKRRMVEIGYAPATASTYYSTSCGRIRGTAVDKVLEFDPPTGTESTKGGIVAYFTRARISHVLPEFNDADREFLNQEFGPELLEVITRVKERLDVSLKELGAEPAELPNFDKKLPILAPPRGKPGRKPKKGSSPTSAQREIAAWEDLQQAKEGFVALSTEDQLAICNNYLDEIFDTPEDQKRAAQVLRHMILSSHPAFSGKELYGIVYPEQDTSLMRPRVISKAVRSIYTGLNKGAGDDLIERRKLSGDEDRPIRLNARIARRVLGELLLDPETAIQEESERSEEAVSDWSQIEALRLRWKAIVKPYQEAKCYEFLGAKSDGGYNAATSRILAHALRSDTAEFSAKELDRYLLLVGEDRRSTSEVDFANRRREQRQVINSLLRRKLLDITVRDRQLYIKINPRVAKTILKTLLKMKLSSWAKPPAPRKPKPDVVRIRIPRAYTTGLPGTHPSDPMPVSRSRRGISGAPAAGELTELRAVRPESGDGPRPAAQVVDVDSIVDRLDDEVDDPERAFWGNADPNDEPEVEPEVVPEATFRIKQPKEDPGITALKESHKRVLAKLKAEKENQ